VKLHRPQLQERTAELRCRPRSHSRFRCCFAAYSTAEHTISYHSRVSGFSFIPVGHQGHQFPFVETGAASFRGVLAAPRNLTRVRDKFPRFPKRRKLSNFHSTPGRSQALDTRTFHARVYSPSDDRVVMGQHFAIFDTDFILQPGLSSPVLICSPGHLNGRVVAQGTRSRRVGTKNWD